MEGGVNKAAAWLGVVTGALAILAFFGVSNVEELRRAVADSVRSDDSLSDPCKAVPTNYLSTLRVTGPRHDGDEFQMDWPKPKRGNSYRWNCYWSGPDPEKGIGNLARMQVGAQLPPGLIHGHLTVQTTTGATSMASSHKPTLAGE